MTDFCVVCYYVYKKDDMISVGYQDSMCVECAKTNLRPEARVTRKERRELEKKDLPLIKGPTKEDFDLNFDPEPSVPALNFDRDPEWDNAVRIANALAIVEDYQSTLYGKNSLTKPDVGIMLSRIAEALEDDLC